ncbi:MAG: outer membrane protein assembly factor BamD [Bacteroidetes bacterium]|nr:MAG: outer membrane protein assembly factor BamD [Bacteroidota bacterium]
MRYICFVLAVLVSFAACSPINKILKKTDYDYKLQKADEYFAKKKYTIAQTIYEDVFPVMKGTAKYEDMYYKFAYCHYYQKDYINAEYHFKGFVESFPHSSKADECAFLQAYCFYKQSPRIELDQTASLKAMTYLGTFIATHPNSPKNKEAADIIDQLRAKLEAKEYLSAELYYNMGYFRAAATAFTQLINNYPDSDKSDAYKLMVVKSTMAFAKNSIELKQLERYELVLNECADFTDRFPESKLVSEVDKLKLIAENKIKSIKNEQSKAAAKL